MAPQPGVTFPERRFIVTLVVLALFAVFVLPASAAKLQSVAALHLTMDRLEQPYVGPSWCLDEDDWHDRTWEGSLSGTFTATENYCNNELYQGQEFDGGGESIGIDIYGTGQLGDISISGHDKWGTFYERTDAMLVYSTVVGHGRNAQIWNEYKACVSLRSPGYTGWPFAGPWTISISGDFANLNLEEESSMFPSIEDRYCPPGQGP